MDELEFVENDLKWINNDINEWSCIENITGNLLYQIKHNSSFLKKSTITIYHIDSNTKTSIECQSYSIDGYYLDHLTLWKSKPNTIFTDEEVVFWKDLFSKVKIINN